MAIFWRSSVLLVVNFLLIGLIHCDLKFSLSRRFPVTDDSVSQVWLSLENPLSVPIALLRHHTPFDIRFGANAFDVSLNGELVDYIGPVVTYAKPSIEDYVVILPGSALEFPVDLKDSYDLTQVGLYDIALEGTVLDYVKGEEAVAALPSKTWNPVRIFSDKLTFYLDTPRTQLKSNFGAVYTCSSSETSTQNSAYSAEKTLIVKAVNQINLGNTPNYVEWFGAYLASRHSTAKSVLTKIASNSRVVFRCDDTSGVYAYVYPSDSAHNVYCCKAFWTAARIGGYDTQAGTIIHELSHFSDIGSTNDYVYGTTGARNLAKTNPANAVRNADNYEYFSEVLAY